MVNSYYKKESRYNYFTMTMKTKSTLESGIRVYIEVLVKLIVVLLFTHPVMMAYKTQKSANLCFRHRSSI